VNDETAISYLQDKYNISCHILKTSLHHHVKHKSLKSCICSTNSSWQSCTKLFW